MRRARIPVENQAKRKPPAKTIEGRESQMISLAIDLAEKQMIEGTASSQVIAHYLRMGSVREQVERDILIAKHVLLEAQAEAYQSSKRTEELYKKALKAMRTYSGDRSVGDEEDV